MCKRKKIKKLQQQVEKLESKLVSQEVKPEEPKKRHAKTAVNVYFDSNFVNSLMPVSDVRYGRDGSGLRTKKKTKHKKLRLFLRILWKLIVYTIIISAILAVLSVVVMGAVWLLVNVGVLTATQNPFIVFVWRMLEITFGLFGMTIPTI